MVARKIRLAKTSLFASRTSFCMDSYLEKLPGDDLDTSHFSSLGPTTFKEKVLISLTERDPGL